MHRSKISSSGWWKRVFVHPVGVGLENYVLWQNNKIVKMNGKDMEFGKHITYFDKLLYRVPNLN